MFGGAAKWTDSAHRREEESYCHAVPFKLAMAVCLYNWLKMPFEMLVFCCLLLIGAVRARKIFIGRMYLVELGGL